MDYKEESSMTLLPTAIQKKKITGILVWGNIVLEHGLGCSVACYIESKEITRTFEATLTLNTDLQIVLELSQQHRFKIVRDK